MLDAFGSVQLGAEGTTEQRHLLELASRYLKPIAKGKQGRLDNLNRDLKRLNAFFSEGTLVDRLAYWYDGVGDKPATTGPTLHRAKLALGFAWAPINAKPMKNERAKGEIVMQAKAYLLPEPTFVGVMFHEATHYILGTKDVKYDQLLPGHTNLEQLSEMNRYKNADNWRVFYQLVSAYRRHEPQTLDDAFICSAHWLVPQPPHA
jgi:hypothetical protein